jgi:HEAT repeat protein
MASHREGTGRNKVGWALPTVSSQRQRWAEPTLHMTRVLSLAAALVLTVSFAFAQDDKEKDKPKPAPKLLPWYGTLVEGYANAVRQPGPILVRVGATWCGWCKKLDEEIAKPKVQAELRRWTLVYLDMDKSPQETKTLGIGPVPALRVMTPAGRQVASHDGYLSEEKLLAWLKEKYDTSEAPPAEVLVGKDTPSGDEVKTLVEMLSKRDPALREAALRRLSSHPDVAAQPVAEAFRKGPLQTRLAALELLQIWKAPVAELDPWKPESLTPEKLDLLTAWSKKPHQPISKPETLPADLLQAKQEVARMLKVNTPAEASAIREQLARHGKALLPIVYEYLKTAQSDQDRERLTALRYRLVASERLALQWPTGLEQLASTQSALRNQAAQDLARRAGAEDEALLLELFSDPEPLIREICLRTLHAVIGDRATESLTRLLADPDPNVRTAVLKQLEERPSNRLIGIVATFTATEKDPDLLVHAIRVLRTLKNREAMDCLKKMLTHENWRVRAEAADILCGFVRDKYGNQTNVDPKMQQELQGIFLKLLVDSDGFVVSRGVKGLHNFRLREAVEPLAKVLAKHPDLAKDVMDGLQQIHESRDQVLAHIRRFCGDINPEVRAVAIGALCQMQREDVAKELHASLKDDDSGVRRAGASALYTLLSGRMDSPVTFAQNRWQRQARDYFAPPQFGSPVQPNLPPPPVIRTPPMEKMEPPPQPPPPEPSGPSKSESFMKLPTGHFQKTFPLPSNLPAQDREEIEKQLRELMALQEATPQQQERYYDGRMMESASRWPSTSPAQALPRRVTALTGGGYQGLMVQVALSGQEAATLAKEGAEYDKTAEEFLAGKGRPQWISDCIPLLRPMLEAKNAEERLAAALCLVALGQEKQALPVVLETARVEATLRDRAAAVFGWLPWARRVPVFQQMLGFNLDTEDWKDIVIAFASTYDSRAIPLLWDLSSKPDLRVENGGSLLLALLQAHLGTRHLYDGMNVVTRYRQWAEQSARQRAASGPDLQRVIGLGMLAVLQPQEAQKLAEHLVADPKTPDALRVDAWQIMLFTQGEQKARQLAARELAETDGDVRLKALALRVVAFGLRDAGSLRGGKLSLEDVHTRFQTNTAAGTPQLPRSLHAYHVRNFLTDPHPRTAAAAAYVLTLMGEKDSLDPLLRYWSAHASTDERVIRMVYRAIGAADDDSLVPVLEVIYRRFTPDQTETARDMFYVIRDMKAPSVVRLRKRMAYDLQLSSENFGREREMTPNMPRPYPGR